MNENLEFTVMKFLKVLQRIVKLRVDLIKLNNEEYSRLENKFSEEGKKITKENAEYVKLNNELLNLHMQILKIHRIYSKEFDELLQDENKVLNLSISDEIDKSDIVEKTKRGEISLTNTHPLINDNDFLEELLSYFIDTENYEECEKIRKFIK